jgi:hypothetical protein
MSVSVSHLLNSVGLVLDIVGVAAIWFYGLPEPLNLEGRKYLITGLIDEATKAKARRFHALSKLGLALIIGGFLLQFLSNFV